MPRIIKPQFYQTSFIFGAEVSKGKSLTQPSTVWYCHHTKKEYRRERNMIPILNCNLEEKTFRLYTNICASTPSNLEFHQDNKLSTERMLWKSIRGRKDTLIRHPVGHEELQTLEAEARSND